MRVLLSITLLLACMALASAAAISQATKATQLHMLFVGILGRAADPAGFAFYLSQGASTDEAVAETGATFYASVSGATSTVRCS
jgi:hypothetical protein